MLKKVSKKKSYDVKRSNYIIHISRELLLAKTQKILKRNQT